ncbi:MAG: hypothetical protein R3B48_04910 [Kofleriaceae bacterium]
MGIIGDDPDDGLTTNQRKARGIFMSKAYSVMMEKCGGCHVSLENADFLKGNGAVEVYAGFKDFQPALINYIDASKSRIVTKAEHNGPAFLTTTTAGQSESEYEIMLEWLRAEQRAGMGGGDGSGSGTTYILTEKKTPVVCAGPRASCARNEYSLQGIRPDKTGIDAKVTFLYEVLPTSNAPYLVDLKLEGGAEGAYIESPLFLGYVDGKTEPTVDGDTFYDVKTNVDANMALAIGPGFAGLTGIAALKADNVTPNELALSFQVIDKYKPEGGMPDPTVCKQLANFVANVRPILDASCLGCHGPAANSGGKGAMLINNDNAASCQQAKARATDLNNIPATALFVAPKPGASGHPFKLNPSTAWETAVTNWLTAEKNSP